MIRISNSRELNKIDRSDVVSSLDQLVESVGSNYSIPSSQIDKMKSGLENVLYEYLSDFLSHMKSNEEIIQLTESSSTDKIVESIKLNESVVLSNNKGALVRFENSPDGFRYQFLGFDASSVPSKLLIESWNCEDADEMIPLIDYILSRKEL